MDKTNEYTTLIFFPHLIDWKMLQYPELQYCVFYKTVPCDDFRCVRLKFREGV